MFDKKLTINDRLTQLHNLNIIIKNAINNYGTIKNEGEIHFDQNIKDTLNDGITQLIESFEVLSNRLWVSL